MGVDKEFRDFVKKEWGLKSDAEAEVFANEIIRRKVSGVEGPPAFAPQGKPQKAMTIDHEVSPRAVTIDAPIKQPTELPAYAKRLVLAGQGEKTISNSEAAAKYKAQQEAEMARIRDEAERGAVAEWERTGALPPLSAGQFRTGIASAGQNMARAAAPYWARLEKAYLTPSPDPWDGPKPVKK